MIKIFDTKQQLAQYFGEFLLEATRQKPDLCIALSGGSTPKAIFDVLAHRYAKAIDWTRLKFFWGDERCVAPHHPESNFGMIREHLFDHVKTRAVNIFRVKGELSLQDALVDYTNAIEEYVPTVNGWPQFDIMMLGMGDDGHTASIFPHQIHLWDSNSIAVLAQHPVSGQNRVSLTGSVINNSKNIFFLVTGANKAEKADEIINQRGDYRHYPAALVDSNKTIWLMDKEAAAKIRP
ncbi:MULTISPECIES: 6-phosphogluconolactonase [unclassified Carboxylicivirga]|uniref:6-phosphogluconolactonase n=1 Tax=Carboxylicivirga TaxID=1628153 RepID=UPI003D325690